MKNVFKLITILSLAILVLSCKKEVEEAATEPQPRELVLIRRDPHMDEYYVQTVDVT